MHTTNTTNTTAIQPTTQKPLYRHLATLAMACAAMAVGGCAALSPSTPEQIVHMRATEYWEGRIGGQYEKAYALTAPSYRKLRTESQFKMQFGAGASIERAEVKKIDCEPEKCNVQLQLGVKPLLPGMNMGTVSTFVNEIWLLEEGQWWHHQDL